MAVVLGVAASAVVLGVAASTPAASRDVSPAQRAAALAKAAGCGLKTFPSEGVRHTTGKATYRTNPPTSGPHSPVAAEDGSYAPGEEPRVERWVHSLEHGRVLIQYRPGTPKRRIDALETLGVERLRGSAGYHVLVFQNNTRMPYAVAAVAWRRYVGCRRYNTRTLSALRAFRRAYTDRAPELVP